MIINYNRFQTNIFYGTHNMQRLDRYLAWVHKQHALLSDTSKSTNIVIFYT